MRRFVYVWPFGLFGLAHPVSGATPTHAVVVGVVLLLFVDFRAIIHFEMLTPPSPSHVLPLSLFFLPLFKDAKTELSLGSARIVRSFRADDN